MTTTIDVEKLWSHIDEQGLIQLACQLVDIPSPTGHEGECALFLEKHLRELGLRVQLQEVEPERYNVLARLPGSGGGRSLMFNGHMDTSYSGSEPELKNKPAYLPKAFVEDGMVQGLGIHNMKGSLACYVAAVEAVLRSGYRLAGDVLVAAVVGEIEKAPVDEFQGRDYRGVGIGTSYLVTHGGVADMAIIGEPTGLALMPGHHGYTWIKVTLYGDLEHTVAMRGRHTFRVLPHVLEALFAWGDKFSSQHSYLGRPAHVNITSVRGGWPTRSRTPGACHIYIDVRQPPQIPPLQVYREVQETMARLASQHPELEWDAELYVSCPGAHLDSHEPVYQAVEQAHKAVFGQEPRLVNMGWSSDAWILNRCHVPTVNYGPSGRDWNPEIGERVRIQDLVDCTRVYLHAIAHLAGGSA